MKKASKRNHQKKDMCTTEYKLRHTVVVGGMQKKLHSSITVLIAVIFFSCILISCGRLNMEGIEPRNRDVYNPVEEVNTPTFRPGESPELSEPLSNQAEKSAEQPDTDTQSAEDTITIPEKSHEPSETDGPPSDLSADNSPRVSKDTVPSPKEDSGESIGESGQTLPESFETKPPEPSESPGPTPPPPQSSEDDVNIVNPYVPYTYEQMKDESLKLAELYPDIITLDSIGSSAEGRELTLIKLGKGDKKIILCGSHHAREYISSSYLMKMVEEYSKAYSNSGYFGKYNVREILDKICIYVVPMVNPDGVNLVNKGLAAVNNKQAVEAMVMMRSSYREWKANINGVDLNRQYPAKWDEKYDEVGKPASESFKGAAPGTEPEIQAMMKLSRDNEFILAASFHTKGNVIYWADRGTVGLIPGVKDMTKKLAALTRYQNMPVSEDPSIYGAGYENWFRLEFLRPAFCIELTPYNNTDLPHDDKKFDSLVWKNAKYIGLFFADEALRRK
jgi:predicted deacylase